ncbi:MAG TPA: hypothetical protein ENI23_00340 [bacterium]|nr:hypothetical protein [bacterium]
MALILEKLFLDELDDLSVTNFTTGSVLFIGASSVAEDNANLFWDDSNNRMGIGIASPDQILHVFRGSAGTVDAFSLSAIVVESNGSTYLNFLTPNGEESGLLFGDAESNIAGQLVYSHISNTIKINTNGVTKLTIDADGNFEIPNGTLNAAAANSVQLASQDFAVGDARLYIQGESGDFISIGNNVIDITSGDLTLQTTTSGDIILNSAGTAVLPKASGNGIRVDVTTPTFGFADIIGDQFAKNTGATKPTLTVYNGVVQSFQFAAADEVFISYHIPHDYVLGTDIFLHVHWSHIGTLVTGGTITFKATSIYAKGHNQAAFTSTPASGTFTGTASATQYQHILSEIQYSASSPTGLQVDTDLLEPDGVIELTLEVDANDITVSSGGVPDPFIHFVDVHYQTTGLIGTKAKAPDFYV